MTRSFCWYQSIGPPNIDLCPTFPQKKTHWPNLSTVPSTYICTSWLGNVLKKPLPLYNFRTLIQYCYMDIIRSELEDVKHAWNVHRIRKQKVGDIVSGIPDLLFNVPALLGELFSYHNKVIGTCTVISLSRHHSVSSVSEVLFLWKKIAL